MRIIPGKCAMFTKKYDYDNKDLFPYPREESLEKHLETYKEITAEDGKSDYVRYPHKIKDGEIFDEEPFVGYSYLRMPLIYAVCEITREKCYEIGKLCYILDDNIHEAYAKRLLPKTVSYAAGFLNYFFRGKIDLVPDDETASGLVIENLSSEDMDGTFGLYYDRTDGKRLKLREKNLAVAAGGKSDNIGDITIPEDAEEPGKYILQPGDFSDAEDTGKHFCPVPSSSRLPLSHRAVDPVPVGPFRGVCPFVSVYQNPD